MTLYPESPLKTSSPELGAIASTVRSTVADYEGDSLKLLALLRLLEALHREIRDGVFQESLPDNRQALYALLRNIEADGGWPYIYRMRLQSLLSNLPEEDESDGTSATF
jgi:hypothetical protein